MKEILYNYNNLTEEDITETVIRTKALIVNSKNELLLGYCHKTYQFPGGHLEEGETLIDCIIRELEEEIGIKLTLEQTKPFFLIKNYTQNYHGTGENRCSEIYYFEIKTDEPYNLSNINYTENEQDGNFELKYISLDNIGKVLNNSIPDNPINEIIVKEMLEVINEYQKSII